MRKLNFKLLTYYSLVALLFVWSNEAVSQNTGFEETKFNERTLIGYSNKHTVRSGETIEFKLSGLNGGQANAQLVQIINGELFITSCS